MMYCTVCVFVHVFFNCTKQLLCTLQLWICDLLTARNCSVWKVCRLFKTFPECNVIFAIQSYVLQHPDLPMDIPPSPVLDVQQCLSWTVVRTLFHTLDLNLQKILALSICT